MTLTEDQRGQVEANMGLIGKVLKDKLRGSSALGVYTHEDLFQIGCVGLCNLRCPGTRQSLRDARGADGGFI